MTTRVLLADDHPAVLLGVRDLLAAAPDIEVIAEASDGLEALRLVGDCRPDVAILDIAMPGLNGLEVTRQIRSRSLPSKVLIFTVSAHDQYLFHVIDAGGLGYVLKAGAYEELVDAVRTVARGEPYLCQDMTRLLLIDFIERAGSGVARERLEALSEREREVLTLITRGYTSQQIGQRLGMGANIVETNCRLLMEKLNLHSCAGLVQYARRKGLLNGETGWRSPVKFSVTD